MFVRIYQKKKILFLGVGSLILLLGLFGRLMYLMIVKSDYYAQMAQELHERERDIKAARGRILDRNGIVLADNKTVCTISVIYSQMEDREAVIDMLCKELDLTEEYVRKRVEKYSSRERIKSNVDKEIGDRIRAYDMPGVKVDEDYKRYYPYSMLASKVLGFTGSDNQGIIGLEVMYEDYLSGTPGKILTVTDAKGIELQREGERREEPIAGQDLTISLDLNIQNYAMQLASQAYETKEAENVMILVMNPQNGEIYACVNWPEFDLNNPYELTDVWSTKLTGGNTQDNLNKMWRNGSINDTYEPGSTFKIITAAAGLEEGVVTPEDTFSCPGFIMVEDRRIRCHKTTGHGAETFVQGTQNSCNPVFITVGMRLGVEKYYSYFEQFGLKNKTGIDLPGESRTIVHRMENMGPVELATMSFGQSFQITPVQLATSVSALINGGRKVTPHLAVKTVDDEGNTKRVFTYDNDTQVISEETSETLREILEEVVADGTGKNGAVEGFRVGGKTATSETLPRGQGKYIASFLGFAPADNPQVVAVAIVNHPKGNYYGGAVAAPIIRQLFENILPYLEEMDYNS